MYKSAIAKNHMIDELGYSELITRPQDYKSSGAGIEENVTVNDEVETETQDSTVVTYKERGFVRIGGRAYDQYKVRTEKVAVQDTTNGLVGNNPDKVILK
jgi:hypothetical protein